MQTAVQPLPASVLPPYTRPPLHARNPTGTLPASVATLPARKRKRPHHYTVSYSEVKEVDTEGKLRDVIVIEDTPPPPTASPATTRNSHKWSTSYQPTALSAPIRTRARAAAEAQAMSSSASGSTVVAPVPKKRKRDLADDPPAAKKAGPSAQQHYVSTTNSWASGSAAATEDVSFPRTHDLVHVSHLMPCC